MENVANSKERLELEKLVEEISRSRMESFLAQENALKAAREASKHQAETTKLQAEAAKLQIEALKTYKELKWYEVVVIVSIAVSATLAVTGIVKAFF